MRQSYGNDSLSKSRVYEWHQRFRHGRESAEDDKRSGRPETAMRSPTIKSVLDIVNDDRRVTVREIADQVHLSLGSVHTILRNELQMKRVCARWVPHLLTAEQQLRRVQESEVFLRRWRKEGEQFLSRIVTCDEVWVHFYDPETKQQSSVWKHSSSPPPKKAKVVRSTGKVMFIVFFDIRGIILAHAVPQGLTVTGKYYSKVCIIYLNNIE